MRMLDPFILPTVHITPLMKTYFPTGQQYTPHLHIHISIVHPTLAMHILRHDFKSDGIRYISDGMIVPIFLDMMVILDNRIMTAYHEDVGNEEWL